MGNGRLIKITQGEGENIREVELSYDEKSYLSNFRDSLDRNTRYSFDISGNLVEFERDNNKINYSYDKSSNVKNISLDDNKNHSFTYTYDLLDNKTSYKSA